MTLEVMKARRSIRSFRPEPPERSLIERAIAAAVTAPSASNKQPWRFFIVRRRETIREMALATRAALDRLTSCVRPEFQKGFAEYAVYFTRFEAAPTVIVPLYRPTILLSNLVGPRLPDEDRERIARLETDSAHMGVSLAIQNLLLEAHVLGLGTSVMTGPLLADPGLREILRVPPLWEIAALIPAGYAAEDPPPTDRKTVDQVVRWIE
jgi:nitroreductase